MSSDVFFSDYHPDLGIQCLPYHVTSPDIVQHWRGVRFEGASYERSLTQENTLYVRRSLSEMAYVDIRLVFKVHHYVKCFTVVTIQSCVT
jgi:hypothetical protein